MGSTNGRRHAGGSRKRKAPAAEGTRSLQAAVLKGALTAVGITAVGLIIGASLFYFGILSGTEAQYRWVSILILIVSLGIGMLPLLRKQPGKQKLWALAVVGLYFVIRLLCAGICQIFL